MSAKFRLCGSQSLLALVRVIFVPGICTQTQSLCYNFTLTMKIEHLAEDEFF